MGGAELLFLGLMSLAPTSALQPPCEAEKLTQGPVTVDYTSDGDTAVLKAADGTQVRTRFLGIDTPETHFNDKSQGEWAFRAAARLKQLLPKGAEVQVELDRFACDSRGRTLAYVHKNGVNLNRLMIEEGWAVNYCVAPNFKHCEEYGAVVEKNIVQKRGFLADPGVQLPYLFREQGRENDFEYYIGDMHTKLVISSAKMDDIPVAQRVFFYSARRIRPPYRLAVP